MSDKGKRVGAKRVMVGTGGQYPTLHAALKAANGKATVEAPWVLVLGPHTSTEGLVLPEGVWLESPREGGTEP